MQDHRPVAQFMFEHSPDAWSYPVAYGYLRTVAWAFLNDICGRAELGRVVRELDEHQRAYSKLRDEGMSPTAALEHLSISARDGLPTATPGRHRGNPRR